MGIWGHLTVLPPESFTLSQADFTQMILALCAALQAELPLTISSGTLTTPVEDDPEAPAGAVIIESPSHFDASLPFPRLLPRQEWEREGTAITAWYDGSDLAAIEQALRAMPYGQEPVQVKFQIYPDITVLPAARPVIFVNSWTGERAYHVASHICQVALQKGAAPEWLEVPFAAIIERYYGAALEQVVAWA